MRITAVFVPLVLAAAASVSAPSLVAHAGGEYCRAQLIADLVSDCLSDDSQTSFAAIAQLREAGPEGLSALCDEHDRLHAALSGESAAAAATPTPIDPDPRMARLRTAIDAVAKQRDAYASRLYWLTDLDEAKAQAAASGKPILSLRLLGNLDDDRSCANSRFFRSVLYANTQVSGYLREHYILHWESLRPVPKLSIDFGDGRRIERTITGNSIHYVLDFNGAIVDAIPGLYAPKPFLHHLQAAETVLRQSRMMSDPREGAQLLRHWHAAGVVRIETQLRDDLQRINLDATLRQPLANLDAHANIDGQFLAVPAAVVAPSKMRAEVKAVEAVIDLPGAITGASAALDDAMWQKIALLHLDDAAFDERSVAVIKTKMPAETAEQAQQRTRAKRIVEDPVLQMLRTFQQSVAIDSVRNEYQLHRTIHEWLAQPRSGSDQLPDVKAFNERVYAELFMTPLDDPWMGLAPGDAYAALDGGGLITGCK